MSEFVLASASPRRRELLEQIGMDFEIVVPDADESCVDKTIVPEMYVKELALIKATAVAKILRKNNRKHALIIAADTVVSSNGKILGKPKDDEDAFWMLTGLSGKKHEVYTGICVMRLSDGFAVADSEKTIVCFNELSDQKIKRYIKSGESKDKAGAYGIQGKGALFVNGIDGDYFNVVGLPIARLAEILEKEFGKII